MNGIAELFVQNIKATPTISITSGQEPESALLSYRATPLAPNLPLPAELLNCRKYQALLPTKNTMPHSVARQHDQQLIIELQEQHKVYHDKTAKDLPNLNPDDTVYIQLDLTQNRLTHGRVSETVGVADRSCKVRTEKGRRIYMKRRFLKPREAKSQII